MQLMRKVSPTLYLASTFLCSNIGFSCGYKLYVSSQFQGPQQCGRHVEALPISHNPCIWTYSWHIIYQTPIINVTTPESWTGRGYSASAVSSPTKKMIMAWARGSDKASTLFCGWLSRETHLWLIALSTALHYLYATVQPGQSLSNERYLLAWDIWYPMAILMVDILKSILGYAPPPLCNQHLCTYCTALYQERSRGWFSRLHCIQSGTT